MVSGPRPRTWPGPFLYRIGAVPALSPRGLDLSLARSQRSTNVDMSAQLVKETTSQRADRAVKRRAEGHRRLAFGVGLVATALFVLAPRAHAAPRLHARHHHHVANHEILRTTSAQPNRGSFPSSPRRAPRHAHRRAVLLPGPNPLTHRAATRPLSRNGGAFGEVVATGIAIGWARLENPEHDYVRAVPSGDKMERGPPTGLSRIELPPRSPRFPPLERIPTYDFDSHLERPFGRSRAVPLKGTAARLCTPFAGDEA